MIGLAVMGSPCRLGLLVACALIARSAFAGGREAWLPAAVDHVDRHYTALIYTDARGREYVRRLDLTQLGIPLPSAPVYWHANEPYFPADSLKPYTLHVDSLSGYAYFESRRRPDLPRPPAKDLLLDVTLNGQSLPDPILLHYRHGELILSDSALETLRIDTRVGRFLLKHNDELPLSALAGGNFAVDYQTLALRMSVPPYLFLSWHMKAAPDAPAPARLASGVGLQLSYDIAGGRDEQGTVWKSGLFDLALAGSHGACGTQYAELPYFSELRRLDSQCTIDWVNKRKSLTVGDSVAIADLSGAPVRYAGIQLGTDFGLTPYFITQPMLTLAGSARVPSTLEIWVDRMLTLTQPIPAGPFDIENIPVHSGAGQVQAVVQNALGETLMSPMLFYSDTSLLRSGLSAWAFQAGKVRENYGLPDDRYTDAFASLDLRRGMSDWWTVSPHIEAMHSFARLSLGSAIRVGDFGVLELSGSGSELRDGRRGYALTERFSRRGDLVSFSLSHEVTDSDFVQLGYPYPGTSPAEISQASIGISLPEGISMTLNGSRSILRDSASLRLVSAALTIPIGRLGDLLLTALQPIEPAGARFYMATMTLPLGTRTTGSVNAFSQGRSAEEWLELQRNAPLGPGMGYRLQAGKDAAGPVGEAELTANGTAATLRLDGNEADGASWEQAELSGSVVASTAGLHLTRRDIGATAIIRLPWPGVRIYDDDRIAAVTDAHGVAVVPGLLPFQSNRLRLSLDDLPLDAEVSHPEVTIVPGRQQVVQVDFGVSETRHVSARLFLARSGAPVPPGATVLTAGSPQSSPVGYGGLVYLKLSSLKPIAIEVSWPRGSCRAVLKPHATQAPVLDLGRVWCR